MTFTSAAFVVFLPLVLAAYWLLRRRDQQNLLLIAASYLFYGWWDWRFCLLMLASSLVDYGVGLALDAAEKPSWRRFWLGVSLVANLGLLGFFKYFNFFAENLQTLAAQTGWQLNYGTLEIILPVGISFYTFQTLSYSIDVYRRQLKATRNLADYLAFVSFFPQLVAGPIERASRLLPQFAQPRAFDRSQAADAVHQILWGFFKKICVADLLAGLVDPVYTNVSASSGPLLVLATVCFAFQIYCDFSAYSDIAIGVARLFGIELMRNFAYPYFSQSMGEFWRRWHISLSTWFRDYVYIPLGGSHVSSARRKLNTLLTFLISGLWHGAAWRFVAWGGINGAATAASPGEKTLGAKDVPGGESLIPAPRVIASMLMTFSIVCLGWIFFRAATFADAFLVMERMLADLFSASAYAELWTQVSVAGPWRQGLLLLSALVVIEWIRRAQPHPLVGVHRLPEVPRLAAYTLLVWFALDLLPSGQSRAFIYFDF